jgi:hypothetical protein
VNVPLEGQEFLRFACSTTRGQVADFVRGFGSSGLAQVVDQVSPRILTPSDRARPLVWLLAVDTRKERDRLNRVSDWIGYRDQYLDYPSDLLRQAHLLRAVVYAYRYATDARHRGVEGLRRASRARSWDEVPLLNSLKAAGLVLRRTPDSGVLEMRSSRELGSGEGFVDAIPDPGRIELSPGGLLRFVGAVLEPVLALSAPVAEVKGRRITFQAGHLPEPPAMLPVMYWQAKRAFEKGREIAECKLSSCPGPPTRPHLYLFRSRLRGRRVGEAWQWDPLQTIHRERRERYCSKLCSELAAKNRQRGKA